MKTEDKVKAFQEWLKGRPMVPHVCTFVGLPEPKAWTKERVFECQHGKRVTWTEARRALGLPV